MHFGGKERLADADQPFPDANRLLGHSSTRGFRLGQLGRGEEEISVYDDALARFGAAPEPALREQVVKKIEHP